MPLEEKNNTIMSMKVHIAQNLKSKSGTPIVEQIDCLNGKLDKILLNLFKVSMGYLLKLLLKIHLGIKLLNDKFFPQKQENKKGIN